MVSVQHDDPELDEPVDVLGLHSSLVGRLRARQLSHARRGYLQRYAIGRSRCLQVAGMRSHSSIISGNASTSTTLKVGYCRPQVSISCRRPDALFQRMRGRPS